MRRGTPEVHYRELSTRVGPSGDPEGIQALARDHLFVPELLAERDDGSHMVYVIRGSFTNDAGDEVNIGPQAFRIRKKSPTGEMSHQELAVALKALEGVARTFRHHTKAETEGYFEEKIGQTFRFHFDDEVDSLLGSPDKVCRVWFYRPQTTFGDITYAFGKSERVENRHGYLPFAEIDQTAQASIDQLARYLADHNHNPRAHRREDGDAVTFALAPEESVMFELGSEVGGEYDAALDRTGDWAAQTHAARERGGMVREQLDRPEDQAPGVRQETAWVFTDPAGEHADRMDLHELTGIYD